MESSSNNISYGQNTTQDKTAFKTRFFLEQRTGIEKGLHIVYREDKEIFIPQHDTLQPLTRENVDDIVTSWKNHEGINGYRFIIQHPFYTLMRLYVIENPIPVEQLRENVLDRAAEQMFKTMSDADI